MSKELTRTAYLSNLYLATSGSATIPLCTPAQEMADHDASQRATIQQLEARVKESEEISNWYGSLVKRACIGSKETPSLKAYIEQLEARIVSLETEVDMNAWRTSPAMAQAMIDQLVTRNDQLERQIAELQGAP